MLLTEQNSYLLFQTTPKIARPPKTRNHARDSNWINTFYGIASLRRNVAHQFSPSNIA